MINKVNIWMLLTILLILQIPPSTASNTTVIYVYPDNYIANYVGENFAIKINVYNVADLTAYEFKLKFNTTFLKCLTTSIGNLFPPPPRSLYNVTVDNIQGIIFAQVSLQAGENPASGSGSLLAITFNATAGTDYPWRAKLNFELFDDYLYGTGEPPQTIPHQTLSGTYQTPFNPPILNLTINTSREKIYFDEKIIVNGCLTGNGYPIPDALIAFEVDTPRGKIIVARSFATSSLPINTPLEILELTPCDQYGSPKYNFNVGSFAYFKVKVKSSYPEALNVTITVNPHDQSNATLGVSYSRTSIYSGQTITLILCVPIEYTAMSGNATVYANVFTDLPKNGGTPLSKEKNAIFKITGSPNGNPTIINPPPQGTYITILNIHYVEKSTGFYTIYTTAQYLGSYTAQNKQIWVSIAGDINNDGTVSLQDLTILAKHYGHKPPDGHQEGTQDYVYCFNADIDRNGIVSLSDLAMLAKNYGKT